MPSPLLRRALELIEPYLEGNRAPETRVVEYLEPPELAARLDLELGRATPADDLLASLRDYLRYSVRSGHPQFHNQLWSGFDEAGFVGDVFASLANTSMYTFEVAPVATLMELELVRKLCSIVGYPEGEGVFCAGGSHGNLMGMLCARDRAFPRAKSAGLAGEPPGTVFVSDQAHYSYAKAADQLGLGLDRVIRVASDGRGRMDPGALEREVSASLERGERPFLVGATAGTTVLGAFDPLPDLARVCRRHDLWLHVDGSWGGPVLLSERHRHLLRGAELSDSFSWDAHKMMGASLICTAFLDRRRGTLQRVCATSEEDTGYLFHEEGAAARDLGRVSLQCGRRVDALKLWLLWRHHGDRGLAERIDRLFELAGWAVREIEAREELELLVRPESVNVCFRYAAPADEVDGVNLEIRQRLRSSGRALVNFSKLDGRVAMRLVFPNPALTEEDLSRFFDLFVATGREVVRARSRQAVTGPG